MVQAASGYLDMPAQELRRRLRAGETLGEIAASTGGASRAGLIEAVYAARSQQIKARHLAPAEERAELRALRRALVLQVDRARRRARLISAAADYLGLSEAELRAKLASGRTLAQIAAATPGHSRAGLIDAIVTPRRAALQRAVRERRSQPRRSAPRRRS